MAASPLTYVALIAAILLSAFPLYFMFVMASRPNDAISVGAAAAHARAASSVTTSGGCSTTPT